MTELTISATEITDALRQYVTDFSPTVGAEQVGRVVEVGDPQGTPVLVVGCIHGDETAGMAVAQALERLSPRGLALWIVPTFNPDGVAAARAGTPTASTSTATRPSTGRAPGRDRGRSPRRARSAT